MISIRAGAVTLVALLTTVVFVSNAKPSSQFDKASRSVTGQKGEREMDRAVKEFFLEYERANSSSDVLAIGRLYSENFMFAGPHGVRPVQKRDFLNVLPKMKEHFASLGLSETHLQTVDVTPLDSNYVLAKVGWRMKLTKSFSPRYVDAFATYVLARGQQDAFSIVFQLDHQDLATVIQNP